jgi:rhodanese-related sulfurtransferase
MIPCTHEHVQVWAEGDKEKSLSTVILDVRDEDERGDGYIPESLHIPHAQIRQRLTELPKTKEMIAYCQTGQRPYYACRFLAQNGLKVRNPTGGYRTWEVAQDKEV